MAAIVVPAVAGIFGGGVIATALTQIGFGLLVSTILTPKGPAAQKTPGIATKFTGKGDVTPQSVPVGFYATDGHQAAPVYSHGFPAGGFLGDVLELVGEEQTGYGDYSTYIITLSDAPITELMNFFINGKRFSINDHMTGTPHPRYGMSVGEDVGRPRYVDKVWIKFYDGTQAEVDPGLLSTYGDHTKRTWKATSVLSGAAYVSITVKNVKPLNTQLKFRFTVKGIPVFDPRTGITAYSDNAAVIAYNVARGITMPDGRVYGMPTLNLPEDYWFAAMDLCDQRVAKLEGGTERQYRAGYEMFLATPRNGGLDPLTALDDLLPAMSGQVADIGGDLIVRAGGPTTSVLSITDDDILNSGEQSYQPFRGLKDTHNAVSTTFVDPRAKWESREAPYVFDADAVARDGEHLVGSVTLNTVPYPEQVQRLNAAWLKDAQRGKSHVIALGPAHDRVMVFDTIDLTSEVHNYDRKLFEIVEYIPNLKTGTFTITIREVDPEDYVPRVDDILTDTFSPIVSDEPPAIFALDPSATAIASPDFARPGIHIEWIAPVADLTGMRWTVYRGAEIAVQDVADADLGEHFVYDGIGPDMGYTVVIEPVAVSLDTAKSVPMPVTTLDIRPGLEDFDQSVADAVDQTARDIASGLIGDFNLEVIDPILTDTIPLIEMSVDEVFAQTELHELNQQAAQDMLDESSLRGLLGRFETSALIRDAGVYTDPLDGTVRIAGVDSVRDDFGAKISDVEIRVLAQDAKISLRASYAEVEGMIAQAAFDIDGFTQFGNLQARLSSAEVEIDGLSASIDLKASLAVVDGIDVRLSDAEVEIDALGEEIALKVSTAEFSDVETRLQTAEVTIGTIDAPSILQSVSDTRSLQEGVDLAAINSLTSLINLYQTREALRLDLAYAQQDMRALVDEDRVAVASLAQSFGAAIDGNAALINAEKQVRADENSALASSFETLGASLADARGGVAANATAVSGLTTRVTDAEGEIAAQAENLTSLGTTVDGQTATITDHSASLDGIALERTIQLDNNGHISGLVLRSDLDDANAPRSSAAFVADIFAIVGPGDDPVTPFTVFTTPTVVDGVTIPAGVYIADATIRTASIGTLEIAEGAVTVPVRSYKSGVVHVDSASEQIEVARVWINRKGVSTTLNFSAGYDGNFSGRGVNLTFEVFRGNQKLSEFSTGMPRGRQSTVSFNAVDWDTNVGPTIYRVYARKVEESNAGGWTSDGRVFRRSLIIDQFQR